MNIDRAGRLLREEIERVKRAGDSIDRKRSWRPSEKAMAKANVKERIEALELALHALVDLDN